MRTTGAARLAGRRISAEYRRVDGAGGVLDVLGQERTGALGVTRQRRLHNRLVLATQPATRDRATQHSAVAIALRLIVEELGEAQQPARRGTAAFAA